MSDAAVVITEQHAEENIRQDIVRVLKTVFDPEIPVDIYELGLIYGIDLEKQDDGQYKAHIRMTLTTPNCPSAAELPAAAQHVTQTVEGVSDATVAIVWDPPWDRAKMSEEARLSLGFF